MNNSCRIQEDIQYLKTIDVSDDYTEYTTIEGKNDDITNKIKKDPIFEFVRTNKTSLDWIVLSKEIMEYSFNNELENQVKIQFLKEFSKYVHWNIVSKKIVYMLNDYNVNIILNIVIPFIRAFELHINWQILSYTSCSVFEFFDQFSIYLDWDDISQNIQLASGTSIRTLKEFQSKLNWETLSKRIGRFEVTHKTDYRILLQCIQTFEERINWIMVSHILMHTILKENVSKHVWDFIEDFQHKLIWSIISLRFSILMQRYQKNNSMLQYLIFFAKRCNTRLHWDMISSQYLPIIFTREFKNQLNWDIISRRNDLKSNFRLAFIDKINWD